MSDEQLRDAVAKAILAAESIGASWDDLHERSKQTYYLDADAAIAAAEPHIRRKVIEELSANAHGMTVSCWDAEYECQRSMPLAEFLAQDQHQTQSQAMETGDLVIAIVDELERLEANRERRKQAKARTP